MADEAPAQQTSSTPDPVRGAARRLVGGLSLSRIQTIVATLVGLASLVGGVSSLVHVTSPPPPPSTGEVVAVVQTAGSRHAVTDATVEILSTQDAVVATLTSDSTGRARQQLNEGVYVVRVSHPRYAAEVRRVQVLPRQTTEVRANLRSGTSSPIDIDRAVNKGVNAVRKALRF